MARYVAPKTDPWLSRISKGRVNWGMFNVPSATLTTTGAKTGQVPSGVPEQPHRGELRAVAGRGEQRNDDRGRCHIFASSGDIRA